MKPYNLTLLTILLLLLSTYQEIVFGSQELRFALLIGNQTYQEGRLENPHNDVDDMEKSLKAVGFKVRKLKDQNLWEMKPAVVGFGKLLKQNQNTVGLFYFSGHGMQYQGENFLFPIGAMSLVTTPKHLPFETLNVGYLLATMEEAGNRLNLVFLDACRDNSLSKSWFKSRSLEPGLAPIQAPGGSLIAYATGANRRALDGRGQRNSPYTRHLKREILKPGISIFEMLTNVRVAVKKETHDAQAPDFYSGLDGKFCFRGPCGRPPELPLKQIPLQSTFPDSKPTPSVSTFRDHLLDGSPGPEMVIIPAGRFQMGDIQGGGNKDEQPVHEVSVAQFAMGRYEVTVGEFRHFVNVTGYKTEAEKGDGCYAYDGNSWGIKKEANWRNPYFFQTDNHPVVCISWNDAIAYTRWLSRQTGQTYRLPTEAEWEYAARAGSEYKYWWGNKIGANKANCQNKYCGDNFEYTAPVGSFGVNGFGLHDTVGNVWEWTCSTYEETYQGAEQRCAHGGKRFALRGGSWHNNAWWVRSAYRSWYESTERSDFAGLRLAR